MDVRSIANLTAWYDASQITGLSDGDPVTNWPDVSGNSRDVVQATAARQPTYRTNVTAGRPVVRFDGSNDILVTAVAVNNAQPNTYAVVVSSDFPTPGSGNAQGIVHNHNAGAGGENSLFLRSDNADYGVYGGALGLIDVVASTAGFHVVLASFNGTSSILSVDGVEFTGNAGTLEMGGIALGGRADSMSQFLDGDIAEAVVYNSVPSVAERGWLYRYLGRKYGVALAAKAGTPGHLDAVDIIDRPTLVS